MSTSRLGRQDRFTTARQLIPRLTKLLGQMRPTFSVRDVREIDERFLSEHDVTGLIWDVDGTLMAYHAIQIANIFKPNIERLLQNAALRHAVVSNCDEGRFDELKEMFPDLVLVRGYQGPDGTVFRIARGQSDSHARTDVEALLANGYQQIRKPNGELIRKAVDVLGVPASRCVMIGDQYLTDIASANLGGIRSVKVDTYARNTFPWSIRFTQRLELLLFRLVGRRR